MTIIRPTPRRGPLKPHPSQKYALACYNVAEAEEAIIKERAKCDKLMADAIAEARASRPVVSES